MMEIHLRIRNVSEERYKMLQQKALEKTGTKSITSLVRYLLNDDNQSIPLNDITQEEEKNRRIEIRLNTVTYKKLTELGNNQSMTLNKYIRMLLHNHINHTEKIMSGSQLQLLRESNYQLYQIGKNINQIAKALNQGMPATISSKELEKIQKFIDEHTQKVTEVIANTPSL